MIADQRSPGRHLAEEVASFRSNRTAICIQVTDCPDSDEGEFFFHDRLLSE